MRSVCIYDLTDEQIAQAVAGRRARPDVQANIQANRVWDAAFARLAHKAEAKQRAVTRRCSRCGIDTTRPDLCIDCEDVLLLEVS